MEAIYEIIENQCVAGVVTGIFVWAIPLHAGAF